MAPEEGAAPQASPAHKRRETPCGLTLIAAGSEVCVDQVQTTAPPGIRVLACGF